MKTIYKYELELAAVQEVEMPACPNFLDVQIQGDKICVWAQVDTEVISEAQRFFIVGTGKEIPPNENLNYIGTVQQGAFVWHVWVQR